MQDEWKLAGHLELGWIIGKWLGNWQMAGLLEIGWIIRDWLGNWKSSGQVEFGFESTQDKYNVCTLSSLQLDSLKFCGTG